MEKSYERKNRLAQALAMRGMKQVELCEKTGLKPTSVNGWVKQNWQPKQTPLYLMAKALDVSEMWLAGYDVPMERPAEQKKIEMLNEIYSKLKTEPKYARILSYVVQINDAQLGVVEAMLKAISEENK